MPTERLAAADQTRPAPELDQGDLRTRVDDFQRQLIRQRLIAQGGNVAAAARTLGMDRGNLVRLANRLGLDVGPRRG
nr:helix-turn-helix domain-containing protein [Pseudomonas sp. dw_358]